MPFFGGVRNAGLWDTLPVHQQRCTWLLGFLAWAQKRKVYALLGLKGPSLEAPGSSQGEEARKGVKVELVGLD